MDKKEIIERLRDNGRVMIEARLALLDASVGQEKFDEMRKNIDTELEDLNKKREELKERADEVQRMRQVALNEKNKFDEEMKRFREAESDLAAKTSELDERSRKFTERENILAVEEQEFEARKLLLDEGIKKLEEDRNSIVLLQNEISRQKDENELKNAEINEALLGLEQDRKVVDEILLREKSSVDVLSAANADRVKAAELKENIEKEKEKIVAESENVNRLMLMQSHIEEENIHMEKKKKEMEESNANLRSKSLELQKKQDELEKRESAFKKVHDIVFGVGKRSDIEDSSQEGYPPVSIPVSHGRLFLSQNFYPIVLLLIVAGLVVHSLIQFHGTAFFLIMGIGIVSIAALLAYLGLSYLFIAMVKTELYGTYLLARRPLFLKGVTKVRYDDIVGISQWDTFADRVFGVRSLVLYIKGVEYHKTSFVPFANPYSISGIVTVDVEKWKDELMKRCNLEGVV